MDFLKRKQGQTVIETALLIILILIIFFGIAEIARAWWLKGQLNNAARVGVRVAVVESPLTLSTGSACPGADHVVQAACNAITSQSSLGPTVDVCTGEPSTGLTCSGTVTPTSGQPVTVTVYGTFRSVVPGLAGPLTGMPGGWSHGLIPAGSIGLLSQSVMRHE